MTDLSGNQSMASAALPSVASTKETTNYARLCRLLVDVGSQALRDTFDGIHPPAGLHGVLARHPEHATLQTLRRKKILNPTQWGNLYPTTPSAVSSASFDVTLLMVLLRNICGLYPPVTGWDSLPLATDASKEANIARVKYFRNTVYGHASQASVDEPTFNAYWQDISNAVVALGGTSYRAVINKLKIECMDPDTEEHYRELLKQWKRDEDSIKEKLEEIEVVLKQLTEEKGDIKDKLEEVEGSIKVKLEQVENQVGIEAENIKENLQQMGNRVKDVSDKLDSLTESTQDKDKIRNDLQELKSEMANIGTKMDTLMTQRQETTDEDQASDDFQKIRREIQNMAEKLNTTQIFLREVTKDEGSTKDKLEEVKDVIENIKVKLDTLMNQPPSVTREPGMEDEFDPAEIIDEIRQLYKLREGWLAPFPWCEEFHFHLDDIFTRLKVVSRKKTRGTATTDTVDMSGIFKPHEECPQPRTVLIEGKPGMGKTTYCQKLVYDWATGKRDAEDCFPRFETVLLLRCRDMKSGLWEAIDDQLLPRDVKVDVRERFFDFIRHNQSKVLLILDGLDEVPATKIPMFSEIIQGRVLPKCRVVATARHEAGIRVRIHCDTLLEIEGFSNTDAWEFIYKFFKTMEDLAEKLVSKLNDDENLRQMAANPLNTALFCLLCEEFQGVFPKSSVRCVLRRYIQKKGLPETNEDPIEAYKPQLKHLGWIALNGLREDTMDFDESELGNYSADLPGFGFLSVQPGGSKLRPRRRYGFLHKSFQEFFAAFYLCCQLLDKEISPDSFVSDRKYFHELKEVLKFACSLLAAHCKETTTALFKSIGKQVEHDPERFFLLLECIEECEKENSNFHLTLARASGSVLKLETLKIKKHHVHLDIVVLAEALKGNSSVTKLNLPHQKIGHAGAAVLAGALRENLGLKVLNLPHHKISNNGAAAIAEGLKRNSSLTELDLTFNEISDAGAAALAGALRENSSLTVLNLPHNKIGVAGAAALGGAFSENSSLTVLDLNLNKIGDAGATALFEGLRENSSLTRLELSYNRIGDGSAAALAKALSEKLSLTSLGLSTNDIGVAGAAALAETLRERSSLTVLDLSDNDISGAGAAALGEVLRQNSSLTMLGLCKNDIRVAGAAPLIEGLRQNSSLTVLDLSANDIGDSSAAALAEVLREKSSLTKLYLHSNNIGVAGSTALAEALKETSTLTDFDLSFNGICDAGATALGEALRQNSSLKKLDLSHSDIGVAGVNALAEALRKNTSLTLLKLPHNHIGDAGAAGLAGALKENSSLTVLKLSSNDIGDAGVAALAGALRENSTLTRLKLNSNNITDAGAAALTGALTENTSLRELFLVCNNFSDAVEQELRGMEHGDRIVI